MEMLSKSKTKLDSLSRIHHSTWFTIESGPRTQTDGSLCGNKNNSTDPVCVIRNIGHGTNPIHKNVMILQWHNNINIELLS